MKKQKNKLYVVTVCVVIFLLAAGFFFSKKEKQDTVTWNTYTNSTYQFSLKIPSDFEFYESNDAEVPTLTDILLYDGSINGKDHIVSSAPNPLLVLIENKAKYIKLDINRNSFVSKSDFDMKAYISKPLGGPHGDIQQKLITWENFTSDDGRTVMYLYRTELVTTDKTGIEGVIWMSNGVLYNVRNETNDSEFVKTIAKTFSPKKK